MAIVNFAGRTQSIVQPMLLLSWLVVGFSVIGFFVTIYLTFRVYTLIC